MQRTVVGPADLSEDALEELKSWLGISRPAEDHVLTDLLRASIALCEAFIGQVPLEQVIEERLSTTAGSQCLVSRPVREVLRTETQAAENERDALDEAAFEYTFSPDGIAVLHLRKTIDASAVISRVRVGMAATWSELPAPLKQGIIRLAAYHYRDRDGANNPAPPSSVAALWRPWRRLSLA
ncbi:MAG: hypothetical protein V2I27_09925 [Erythrobacter sp.]|nr:hypothetical protein [Erythrobacter sp.]